MYTMETADGHIVRFSFSNLLVRVPVNFEFFSLLSGVR